MGHDASEQLIFTHFPTKVIFYILLSHSFVRTCFFSQREDFIFMKVHSFKLFSEIYERLLIAIKEKMIQW